MGSFKKNGFSTHNNTIASYGCLKKHDAKNGGENRVYFLYNSGTSHRGPSDKGTVYYIPLHNEQN